MKPDKGVFIIIVLVILNITILLFFNFRSKNYKNNIADYQNDLFEQKAKTFEYIEKIISYNYDLNKLLSVELKLVNSNNEQLIYSQIVNKYKIVIYFPKMACEDCLHSLFEQISEYSKLESTDFLLISDFYSLNELKLYKKKYILNDFEICFLVKSDQLISITDPIIFSTNKSNYLFIYDIQIKDLLNNFLNNNL